MGLTGCSGVFFRLAALKINEATSVPMLYSVNCVLAGVASLWLVATSALAEDAAEAAAEKWHAYSYSAEMITGDVIITPDRLEMLKAGILNLKAIEGYTPNLFQYEVKDKLTLPEGTNFCSDGSPGGYLILNRSQQNFLVIDVFKAGEPPEADKTVDLQPSFCGSYTYNKS